MITRLLQVVILMASVVAALASGAELDRQSSIERGVTVAVSPINLTGRADVWQFKVVFDTHSQELFDDLMKSAVLMDGKGNEHQPIAWEGAGPGGHHREGVLKFNTIAPAPASIELRIARPDEPAPRSFRWTLQ